MLIWCDGDLQITWDASYEINSQLLKKKGKERKSKKLLSTYILFTFFRNIFYKNLVSYFILILTFSIMYEIEHRETIQITKPNFSFF